MSEVWSGELPEAAKNDRQLQKLKKMNDKLWEIARKNFPDYFKNPDKIAIGFSIAVDKKFRNTKIA